MKTQIKPSRMIGPEDIRVGDYITVTHTTYEFIFGFCASEYDRDVKPHRVTCMSDSAGIPLCVESACLPFVLVRSMYGQHGVIDLRRHRVARLTKTYGRRAFKAVKKREQTHTDCPGSW